MGWSVQIRYHLGAIIAGAIISLALSSVWPLALVVALACFDLSLVVLDFAKSSTLTRLAAPPPIIEKYMFSLAVDDQELSTALGLTPDECGLLAGDETRPNGFVLENCGEFLRWRILVARKGSSEERTVDWDSSVNLGRWQR